MCEICMKVWPKSLISYHRKWPHIRCNKHTDTPHDSWALDCRSGDANASVFSGLSRLHSWFDLSIWELWWFCRCLCTSLVFRCGVRQCSFTQLTYGSCRICHSVNVNYFLRAPNRCNTNILRVTGASSALISSDSDVMLAGAGAEEDVVPEMSTQLNPQLFERVCTKFEHLDLLWGKKLLQDCNKDTVKKSSLSPLYEPASFLIIPFLFNSEE